MSNILVLTGKYCGAASANGICARNIVKELKGMGHNVYILSREDNDCDNTDNVFTIKTSINKRKPNLITKVCDTFINMFCANVNNDVANKFIEEACLLCEEKNIDVVVCFFFPLETVVACGSIKSLYPNIKTVIYELDSIGDGIFAITKTRAISTLMYEKWTTHNYEYADNIIIMKSHEKYWMKKWGKRFGNKLIISDIPVLLSIPEKAIAVDKSVQPISFIYAGELNKMYRSPLVLLDLLQKASSELLIDVKFYTKGNCEKTIAQYKDNNSFIHQFGYVPTEILEKELQSANVLLSIGNKKSNSVPSKLISYLSYGKPIVHITSNKNDVCKAYIDKYPLGLVLYEQDPIDINVNKFVSFVKDSLSNEVDFAKLGSDFEMNKPFYGAKIIDQIAQKGVE